MKKIIYHLKNTLALNLGALSKIIWFEGYLSIMSSSTVLFVSFYEKSVSIK